MAAFSARGHSGAVASQQSPSFSEFRKILPHRCTLRRYPQWRWLSAPEGAAVQWRRSMLFTTSGRSSIKFDSGLLRFVSSDTPSPTLCADDSDQTPFFFGVFLPLRHCSCCRKCCRKYCSCCCCCCCRMPPAAPSSSKRAMHQPTRDPYASIGPNG